MDGRPPQFSDLGHQSRGRDLTPEESALAAALCGIYGRGIHDFDAVARELTAASVVAPISQATSWTRGLIEQEMVAINRSHDEAYAAHGFGA